jgi:hypothetical protein
VLDLHRQIPRQKRLHIPHERLPRRLVRAVVRAAAAAGLAAVADTREVAHRQAESVPTGERPHYHRRVTDPATGKTLPGQGIGRHRPWDTKQPDQCFWDRF